MSGIWEMPITWVEVPMDISIMREKRMPKNWILLVKTNKQTLNFRATGSQNMFSSIERGRHFWRIQRELLGHLYTSTQFQGLQMWANRILMVSRERNQSSLSGLQFGGGPWWLHKESKYDAGPMSQGITYCCISTTCWAKALTRSLSADEQRSRLAKQCFLRHDWQVAY